MRIPMRVRLLTVIILLLFATSDISAADIPDSADHPMLTRYPGSSIVGHDYRTHDQVLLLVAGDEGKMKGQWVAGRMTWVVYRAPANTSTLQLYRNYESALNKAGFETAFACSKKECGSKFIKTMIDTNRRWVGTSERYMPGTARYLSARLPSESGDVWVSIRWRT